MAGRIPTTKDIGLLLQLFKEGQLTLAPEYQRQGVWPRAAKSFLMDTVLRDRPIPMLFFRRQTSAQTGRSTYDVIDGQQRLRAIFEYLDDSYPLIEATKAAWRGKRYSELPVDLKRRILNYSLTMEELSNYSEADARDVFRRMNRYVVKLSPQEMRHSLEPGAFYRFVEANGKLPFFRDQRVFSRTQLNRMRQNEFIAELAILLLEGPQDKKQTIDLYYAEYRTAFPSGDEVGSRIRRYLAWILKAMPSFAKTRYRKPTDLYGLVGALDQVSASGKRLAQLRTDKVGLALLAFESDLRSSNPSKQAARYMSAASRQTDNLIPRQTRIAVLKLIMVSA